MDSKFKQRIQRRLYQTGGNDVNSLVTPSLPLTETTMKYFQDSFPGTEGLDRIDMPMAATITKRNKVSPCSVVMSMLYAKRLRQNSKQYLQSMSSTDVFFISMMMASKYLYDEGVDEEVYNDEWADSVGRDVDDVNKMEMDFLREMDWHLFVKPEEFDSALTAVERQLALKEGIQKGWFTYTEMAILLEWEPMYNLWNQVGIDCLKVVSLLSAVYVASLVSMMGSVAIALQLSGPMTTATVSILSLHTLITTGHSPAVECDLSQQRNIASPLGDAFNSSSMDLLLLGHDSDFTTADGVESVPGNNIDVKMRSPLWRYSSVDDISNLDASVGHETRPKGASVFSLWIFDSLLSHVCSIFGQLQMCGSKMKALNGIKPSGPHLGKTLEPERKRSCPVHKSTGMCRRKRLCNKSKCRQPSSNIPASHTLSNVESSSPLFRHRTTQDFGSNYIGSRNDSGHGSVVSSEHLLFPLPSSLSPPSATNPRRRKGSEGLSYPQCDNCATQGSNPELYSSRSINDPETCWSSRHGNGIGIAIEDGRTEGAPPHVTHTVNEDSHLNLVLPIPMMVEVPILDPIGFVTRNSSPFIIST